MSHESSYTSPSAFRRALTDKLRALAVTSRWTVHQLQRQMAYDRLLERLYLVDDDWIVKGANALLARNLGVRATIDVDVFRAATQEVAEADLREAARRDIGDWFRFDVGPAHPVSDGAAGTRFPVTAFLNGYAEPVLVRVRHRNHGTAVLTVEEVTMTVAAPAALVAMKLHSIQDREQERPAKAASDAEDLYRLIREHNGNGQLVTAVTQAPYGSRIL